MEKAYPGMRVSAMTADKKWKPGRVLWADKHTLRGVCVEFDEPVVGGHNGNDLRFSGKNTHCYWVDEWRPEKTPAVRIAMTPGGRGVQATGSGCHGESRVKDDPFDYAVGGVIAFARALKREPAEVCRTALGLLAKSAETLTSVGQEPAHAKETPDSADIYRSGFDEISAFFNEVAPTRTNLTIRGIGKKTPYHDVNGKLLVTGDVVKVYSEGKLCTVMAYVLEDKDGAFVDSIKSMCNPKTGEIKAPFAVKKVRRYFDVPDGETHNFAVMSR